MKDRKSAKAQKIKQGLDRRRFLQESGATGLVALAAPHLLFGKPARTTGRAIKIGFIAPRTGALERFGEGNDFIVSHIRKLTADGLIINGVSHPIEIIEKDSQSNRVRGSEIAVDMIKSEHIDLMLASSTGETVIPVSDACEANGVPCITTDCPWQSYFFGRNGKTDKGFQWTYHFFWGLEDLIAVFTNMWTGTPTNKIVGALWPNDAEGTAYSDAKFGFPGALQSKGFKLVDPGRFELSARDFSQQIEMFKAAKVEILTGVMPPPAFAAFWKQAAEAKFTPKVATVAKAILFPTAVEALGERGADLTTEIWWSPSFPFKSGLTQQNAAELCAAYEDETKKQWTQPLGFHHALFEVALDVLKRSKDVESPAAIRDAIVATKYDSIVGHISWEGKPVPNVTKTTLVGGQWIPGYKFDKWLAGQKFKYDLVIVNNANDEMIGVQRKLEPLSA
ncbi:MAG TPA: ABC transporter substrate-binding protein [Candidatus Acidoferrum sp.]|jgi:branched-chain amino acid transport system substrate-binding protein